MSPPTLTYDILHLLVFRYLDFASLKAFSLCSQGFRLLSQTVLFRTIAVRASYTYTNKGKNFDAHLSPVLHPFVKTLVLYASQSSLEPPPSSIIRRLANLRALRVEFGKGMRPVLGSYQGFTAKSLHHLRALYLLDCTLHLRDMLEILKMRNLRRLSLKLCDGPSYNGGPNQKIVQDIADLGVTRIVSLEIDSPFGSMFKFLSRPILSALSNVRNLRLHEHQCDIHHIPRDLPFDQLEYLDTTLYIVRYLVRLQQKPIVSHLKHVRIEMPRNDWKNLQEDSHFAECLWKYPS